MSTTTTSAKYLQFFTCIFQVRNRGGKSKRQILLNQRSGNFCTSIISRIVLSFLSSPLNRIINTTYGSCWNIIRPIQTIISRILSGNYITNTCKHRSSNQIDWCTVIVLTVIVSHGINRTCDVRCLNGSLGNLSCFNEGYITIFIVRGSTIVCDVIIHFVLVNVRLSGQLRAPIRIRLDWLSLRRQQGNVINMAYRCVVITRQFNWCLNQT